MVLALNWHDIHQAFVSYDLYRAQKVPALPMHDNISIVKETQDFLIRCGTSPNITLKVGMAYADTMVRWKFYFIDAPKLQTKDVQFMTPGIINDAAKEMLIKLGHNPELSKEESCYTKQLMESIYRYHYCCEIKDKADNLEWLQRYKVTSWQEMQPEEKLAEIEPLLEVLIIWNHIEDKWERRRINLQPFLWKSGIWVGRALQNKKIQWYASILGAATLLNGWGARILQAVSQSMLNRRLQFSRRRFYQMGIMKIPKDWHQLVLKSQPSFL